MNNGVAITTSNYDWDNVKRSVEKDNRYFFITSAFCNVVILQAACIHNALHWDATFMVTQVQ